jgi:hypothetical protein
MTKVCFLLLSTTKGKIGKKMIQLVWVFAFFGYTHYMKSLIVEKKTEKV